MPGISSLAGISSTSKVYILAIWTSALLTGLRRAGMQVPTTLLLHSSTAEPRCIPTATLRRAGMYQLPLFAETGCLISCICQRISSLGIVSASICLSITGYLFNLYLLDLHWASFQPLFAWSSLGIFSTSICLIFTGYLFNLYLLDLHWASFSLYLLDLHWVSFQPLFAWY